MPHQLLAQLNARLPELEWKLARLTTFSSTNLPKSLFRTGTGANGVAYIAEIKADIQQLTQQKNHRSALYLATKIQQKINVLVGICQLNSHKEKNEEKASFGIKMLSTRQQWICSLEGEIAALEEQQQAMAKTFARVQRNGENTALILQLQADLGEIERRLTLARETLLRAIS